MRQLSPLALKFLRNEDGPTAVEYAVLLGLILVVCLTAVSMVGSNSKGTFKRVGSSVNAGGFGS